MRFVNIDLNNIEWIPEHVKHLETKGFTNCLQNFMFKHAFYDLRAHSLDYPENIRIVTAWPLIEIQKMQTCTEE